MDKTEHLDLYQQMVVIRLLEERAAELYQKGKIGGFLHLYIGQEAVSTGLISARKPQDRVITAYRDHGVAINCGLPAKGIMAELLGKATGVSGGKGGSMHMADVEKVMQFTDEQRYMLVHLTPDAELSSCDVKFQANREQYLFDNRTAKWKCIGIVMFRSAHCWTYAKDKELGLWLHLNCITENGTSSKVIGERPNIPGLRNVRQLVFEKC